MLRRIVCYVHRLCNLRIGRRSSKIWVTRFHDCFHAFTLKKGRRARLDLDKKDPGPWALTGVRDTTQKCIYTDTSETGAKWGTRTPDLLITNQLLYRLS